MKHQSPCLNCERKDEDKTHCSKECQRLLAYINSESWEDLPIPDLNETSNLTPQIIMCKKCGKKPATLNSAGRVVNGLCGYCMGVIMNKAKREKNVTKKTGEKSGKRAKPGEKKVCEFPECDNPHKARGLCSMHYGKWIRGDLPGWPKYKQRRPKKAKMKSRGQVVETIPESQVAIDLTRFPGLRDIIFSMARRLYVTPEHVIISMLGQAVAARPESFVIGPDS